MPAQSQPVRREAPIESRREGSLKKWKIVSIDAKAIDEWSCHRPARNQGFGPHPQPDGKVDHGKRR